MTVEGLAFLATIEVRQLVASWPRVIGKTESERFLSWSIASGQHVRLIRRWYWPLLKNEIIYADGTIAPKASEYIAVMAMNGRK